MRLRNILTAFDDFAGNEILNDREFQDYQGVYIDLYQDFTRGTDADKENINDDIIFEIELIRQIEVNIDYILMLVAKYRDTNCSDKSILGTIDRAIGSSIELRSKRELIERFIEQVNITTQVEDDWALFVAEQKEKDLLVIIENEKLKPEETRKFMDNSLRHGVLKPPALMITSCRPFPLQWRPGG